MRYLIIGLGIYGTSLARDLAEMGHEVIGVDINETNVEAVKEYVSTTYIVDCTDETALGVLPLKGVDVVIVAIGENFGASVKTVALLKKHDVKHLYARAINDLHYAILECFRIERILTPEQSSAKHLSLQMLLGTDVSILSVTDDVFVAKFAVPAYLTGISEGQLRINLGEFDIRLIAISRPRSRTSILGLPTERQTLLEPDNGSVEIADGDIITCLTSRKALQALMRHIS